MTARIYDFEDEIARRIEQRSSVDYRARWSIEMLDDGEIKITADRPLSVAEARLLWRVLGARIGERT